MNKCSGIYVQEGQLSQQKISLCTSMQMSNHTTLKAQRFTNACTQHKHTAHCGRCANIKAECVWEHIWAFLSKIRCSKSLVLAEEEGLDVELGETTSRKFFSLRWRWTEEETAKRICCIVGRIRDLEVCGAAGVFAWGHKRGPSARRRWRRGNTPTAAQIEM